MIQALTLEGTMTNFKRSVLMPLVLAMVVPGLILVNGKLLENIDLVADLDKIFPSS